MLKIYIEITAVCEIITNDWKIVTLLIAFCVLAFAIIDLYEIFQEHMSAF